MVTLKEVALRAGVTEKTAERALSGVTQGKRRDALERARKVRQAAQELGYYPSRIAQSLRTGKTRSIGFIAERITDQYFSAAVEVVMDEAEKYGYSTILRLMRGNPELGIECVNRFRSSGVDGILFGGWLYSADHPFFQELQKRKFPLLVIDAAGMKGNSFAVCDYSRAMPDAVRFLAGRGHRKLHLALFGDPDSAAMDVIDAFRNECSRLNLQPELLTRHRIREIAELAKQKPSGLLLFGKYSLRIFLEAASSVPDYHPDIIGFYNEWTWAAAPATSLSGVFFENAEIRIRAAVRQLIDEIEGRKETHQLKFPAEFFSADRFPALQTRNLSDQYLFEPPYA